jgi:hypothetical protein
VHGLIHIELERFGRAQLGNPAWDEVTRAAGVGGKVYSAGGSYDDAEVVGLVVSASKAAGVGPQALLEQFGEALAPTLFSTFGGLVDAQWRTLELIANTETLIHSALRASDPSARPPLLRTTPRPPDTLVVHYASERRMCGVAKGIIRGVAAHYGETVEVRDETCMLMGDAVCTLAVRVPVAEDLLEGKRANPARAARRGADMERAPRTGPSR